MRTNTKYIPFTDINNFAKRIDLLYYKNPEKAYILVNAAAADGRTALIWAAGRLTDEYDKSYIFMQLIGSLLQAGANVNAADADGQTALMKAAKVGNIDAVNMLLARGADANAIDNFGKTALAQVDPQRTKIVDILKKKAANQAKMNPM